MLFQGKALEGIFREVGATIEVHGAVVNNIKRIFRGRNWKCLILLRSQRKRETKNVKLILGHGRFW